mmetsp:Transcript_41911/g.98264  ORF Transcript_41911/g.98264 Transcript_41911/m.98264 type:complete len:262 (+) Transcript_41911:458-1243(+)
MGLASALAAAARTRDSLWLSCSFTAATAAETPVSAASSKTLIASRCTIGPSSWRREPMAWTAASSPAAAAPDKAFTAARRTSSRESCIQAPTALIAFPSELSTSWLKTPFKTYSPAACARFSSSCSISGLDLTSGLCGTKGVASESGSHASSSASAAEVRLAIKAEKGPAMFLRLASRPASSSEKQLNGEALVDGAAAGGITSSSSRARAKVEVGLAVVLAAVGAPRHGLDAVASPSGARALLEVALLICLCKPPSRSSSS